MSRSPPGQAPHGGSFDAYSMFSDDKQTSSSSNASVSGHSARQPSISRVPVGSKDGSNAYAQAISPQGSSVSNPSAPVFEEYELKDVEIAKPEDCHSLLPASEPETKRNTLGGYTGNFFSKDAKYQMVSFRNSHPSSYQNPGYTFNEDAEYRHKDHFQRVHQGVSDERFLNPVTGRLQILVVQSTDLVYKGPKNSTYKRTFIRNVSPLTLRLANWPMRGFDDEKNQGKSLRQILSSTELLAKWPVACILILPIISLPIFSSTGQIVNGGGYDPFPYRYWGYCRVTRNALEGSVLQSASNAGLPPTTISSSFNMTRILEPRALCFDGGDQWARTRPVEQWKMDASNTSPHKRCPEYVFVAYTASQFTDSIEDLKAIHTIGLKAARDANVPAYWLGSACMDSNDLENEVFRISDIVRGAHSVVIAIKTPEEGLPEQNPGEDRVQTLLRLWGDRVWTFPEVLLCRNSNMKVYEHGAEDAILDLPKNRLAAYFWNDAPNSRQLLDHYAGNLVLSPLQLIVIALGCLFSREKGNICLWGDHSYALMGLLSQRPQIDPQDSAFEAFARLSLANDSNRVLERLMCLMPKNYQQEWHNPEDAYGVSLWDIEPTCQIAGICENNTVLIDGAFGATIHWDRFRRVNARRAKSAKRILTQVILHGTPLFVILGMCLWRGSKVVIDALKEIEQRLSAIYDTEKKIIDEATKAIQTIDKTFGFSSDILGSNTLTKVNHLISWTKFTGGLGFLFLAFAFSAFVLSPYLTRVLYRGKFWGSQAWLFGFEGYADLETIETQIFGARMHRLRWSPFGSFLSRHYKDDSNECIGQDPIKDPAIKAKIDQAARNEDSDGMRIFTLVDTNTMTVTLFEAVRPPTVVLLCASEGGMQRAIACSYQWMTGTCYRETILRMETPVLEKMSRVARVKLGVRS